jgi:hypothetical protein
MAEFHFLKGSFKGRLGDVVFSSWRGKDYAKTYTPPANPDTPKQHAHREIWGTIGHIAHGIYEAILKPYTFPKPQAYTAYNRMLVINSELLKAQAYDPAKLKILDGALTGSAITAATWSTTNKKIVITWNSTVIGNTKATDKAIIVVVQDGLAVAYAVTTRSTGTYEIDTAVFQKIHNGALQVYLAFAQEPAPGTNEQGMNSITAYKAVTITGLPLTDELTPPASESETEKKT